MTRKAPHRRLGIEQLFSLVSCPFFVPFSVVSCQIYYSPRSAAASALLSYATGGANGQKDLDGIDRKSSPSHIQGVNVSMCTPRPLHRTFPVLPRSGLPPCGETLPSPSGIHISSALASCYEEGTGGRPRGPLLPIVCADRVLRSSFLYFFGINLF